MDLENAKDNQTQHLEIPAKVPPVELGFEGLSQEETRKLEKRRSFFLAML